KAPSAKYTFDSERDAPEAELCRQPNGELSKECIVIHMNSKRLFEAMQVRICHGRPTWSVSRYQSD
ncbi:hypothetical protein M408DRAFT_33032, partial [Serendipita vermifera MAFF 305830]